MKKFSLSIIIMMMFLSSACSQEQIKIACVGNSITEGPGRDNPESYPLQLQNLLGKGYDVKNFGVSGRTLLKNGDYPYWQEPQFESVKAYAPDILIIKLGTNDSKPQNWRYKESFKSDYLDLIQSIKSSMPETGKIYICIPVPVTMDNYNISESVLVNEVRPILLEIAKESGADIIDLYTPFLDKTHLIPDGVHPNIEGLGIMAKEIAKVIQ